MSAERSRFVNPWLGSKVEGWPFQLGLTLTLVTLLLQPMGDWYVRPWLLLIAVLGLVIHRLRSNPWPWLMVGLFAAVRVIADWPLSDNHAYLMIYWGVAIAVALWTPQPARVLAKSSAILIGLVFLFATLWKALSADYMDGRFFALTLVVDPRFQDFVQVVGRMTTETLLYNRDVLELRITGPTKEDLPFRALVTVITWWTLIIEGLLAVVWLVPARTVAAHRHWLTILFCLTTYAVATVASFGWLLVAMSVASLKPDETSIAKAYLVTFCLILAFKHVPIWTLLNT